MARQRLARLALPAELRFDIFFSLSCGVVGRDEMSGARVVLSPVGWACVRARMLSHMHGREGDARVGVLPLHQGCVSDVTLEGR